MENTGRKATALSVANPEKLFTQGILCGLRGFLLKALASEVCRFERKLEKHSEEIDRESHFTEECLVNFRVKLLTAVREHFSRVDSFSSEILRWNDTDRAWTNLKREVETFQYDVAEILKVSSEGIVRDKLKQAGVSVGLLREQLRDLGQSFQTLPSSAEST